VDHVQSENLAFVTHLGDIVNRGYTASQWTNAVAAMNLLDGKIPYGLAPGNHDLMDNQGGFRTQTFVDKFGPSRFSGRSWYGGASSSGFSSYQIVPCGGTNYLYLELDVDAPDSQIAWAQGVINAHPGMPTVVSTHDYLNNSGRQTAPFIAGRNSGEEIWNSLIRPNDQIFMVLAGHVSGQNQQVSLNNQGHKVFELLSDYQSITNGGNGFLRLLSVQPSANRIDVRTYSTTLQRDLTTDDIAGFGAFTCSMDFSERFAGHAAPLTTYVWMNAVSGTLSDNARWNGGIAPDPGNIALSFGGSTNYTVTHNLDSGPFALVCNRLQFANTSGAVTLSGTSNIVLDGPAAKVEQTATGGVYLDVPLQLKAPTTTFQVLSTVYATKDISGLGDMVKTGPGTLVFTTGRLTLMGKVTVEQGTIRSGNNDALGSETTLVLSAGAVFDDSYGNGENFGGLAGSGTYLAHKGSGIDIGYNNLNTTFSGKITAGTNGGIGYTPDNRQITVKKSGAGVTTLSGKQSDFAGTVFINAGTLSIDNIAPRGQPSAIGLGNVNNLNADIVIGTDTESAVLRYTGVFSTCDRSIQVGAAGGTIDIATGGTELSIASLTSSGELTKTGPGSLRITGRGFNLPSLIVNQGTLTATSIIADSLFIGNTSVNVLETATITTNSCTVPEPSVWLNILLGIIMMSWLVLYKTSYPAKNYARG
jgi:autotransporter-associated beta strand protein